ncbi:type II toxin-antitoxin system RelB/DinJ family antitoxin [Candidatus Peregrinibacteria bacterium]|nr:type II toxin-antitoxin system RelB/DinJ family antitoxin [Candidatus Peregrinibacteria bacterium]
MSHIQIRIDQKTKEAARKELKKLGLDMSSAVKLYLHQIIIHKGIPFRIVTENGLTPAEEKAILKASKEAKNGKNVTRVMGVDEALEYLDNLK